MDTEKNTKTNWPAGVIIGASIPIVLIVLGIILLVLQIFIPVAPDNHVYDTTIENAVFFGGLYLALPFGLLNIIVATFARSRSLVSKNIAVTGILIGVLGILLGLLAWYFFNLMSSFVF